MSDENKFLREEGQLKSAAIENLEQIQERSREREMQVRTVHENEHANQITWLKNEIAVLTKNLETFAESRN